MAGWVDGWADGGEKEKRKREKGKKKCLVGEKWKCSIVLRFMYLLWFKEGEYVLFG